MRAKNTPPASYQRTWPRAQKGRPCSRSWIQAACDGAGGRYCAGSRNSSKALNCSLVSSDGCEDAGQGMEEGCGEGVRIRLGRDDTHRGCGQGRRGRVGRALDSDHEGLLSGFEALANEAAHRWEGAARTVAETAGALLLLCVVLGVLLRDRRRRFAASDPRLFVVAVRPIQHRGRRSSLGMPCECVLELLRRWNLGARRWRSRWARWWAHGSVVRQEGYVRQVVSEAWRSAKA